MATKKPTPPAKPTKATRRVLPKVFMVRITDSSGVQSAPQLVRAKTLQAARASVTGKIDVALATPEDLLQAGSEGIAIVDVQ